MELGCECQRGVCRWEMRGRLRGFRRGGDFTEEKGTLDGLSERDFEEVGEP